MNKQTLPPQVMPYLENPCTASIPNAHPTQVLETNYVDQNVLSSEHIFYESTVNTGYAQHATEIQTLQAPATSYHYEDTQMMVSADYIHHSTGLQSVQVPASSYTSVATQQAYIAGNPHYRYFVSDK